MGTNQSDYMREYMREYRDRNPDYRAKGAAQVNAYRRALLRLKALHPGKFKMLYAEEIAKGRDENTAG